MIPHRDEILRPAVGTDATAVPRYNLVRSDGTIIEKNVAMRLSNPVARDGTPISKAVLDEMLAASGVTAGTSTAYTLAQDEYTLFDGAPVRFRLHVASGDGATLNINGTGAKPLRDMMGAAMPGGIPAGTWLTAYYSAAAGAYVLAGGEAVRALYGERYTVDDAVAYVKDVPEDALPFAEVGEIGGMTYKINVGTESAPVYELRSAAATEMKSVGVNIARLVSGMEHFGCTTDFEADGKITLINTNGHQSTFARISRVYLEKGVTYWLALDDIVNIGCGVAWEENSYNTLAIFDNQAKSFTPTKSAMYDISVYQPDYSAIGTVSSCYLSITRNAAQPYTPYFHDVLPIPEAVRALDGYGWGINETIHNYVNWKNKRFVKMCGRVDLGTLSWEREDRPTPIPQRFFAVIGGAPTSYAINMNVLCAKYTAADAPIGVGDVDMTMALHGGRVYILDGDKSYIDAATFKAAMSGVMLYYELATPIITDISDILPADNILGVESGGTVTAVNDNNFAVPTEIVYENNVLGNRASIFALEKLRLAMELLAKADLSNVSGTFGGVVKANAAAVSVLGTAQVRNVTISATDLTAGSSALATGDSYRVYS